MSILNAVTKSLPPESTKAGVDEFAARHPESAGWSMVWSRTGQRVGAYHPAHGLVDDPALIVRVTTEASRAVLDDAECKRHEATLAEVRELIAAAVTRRDTLQLQLMNTERRRAAADEHRRYNQQMGRNVPETGPTGADVQRLREELQAAEEILRGPLSSRLAKANSDLVRAQHAARVRQQSRGR
jgi:hypothetical protein